MADIDGGQWQTVMYWQQQNVERDLTHSDRNLNLNQNSMSIASANVFYVCVCMHVCV